MEDKNNKNKQEETLANIPNTKPPLGTYAATARMMAEIFPDFDWDAWKDEMKDNNCCDHDY